MYSLGQAHLIYSFLMYEIILKSLLIALPIENILQYNSLEFIVKAAFNSKLRLIDPWVHYILWSIIINALEKSGSSSYSVGYNRSSTDHRSYQNIISICLLVGKLILYFPLSMMNIINFKIFIAHHFI